MVLVISSKKVYAAKRLIQEAGIRNLELRIMDVADLVACNFKIDVEKYNILHVRDPYLNGSPKYIPNIIKLAKSFIAGGKKVVDSSIAKGQLGRGKWADYQKLKKAGLPIPKTKKQLTINNSQLTYPLILKWTYGFKAKNVFLINNHNQLKKTLPLHPKKEWLIQEFIGADYEYKVITVGYKALPVVLRFEVDKNNWRPDFGKVFVIPSASEESLTYGTDIKGSPSAALRASPSTRSSSDALALGRDDKMVELVSLAEESSAILKRELAKVDILEAKGKFYILEVNRFPGLKSFEELTEHNVVRDFLQYLLILLG